MHLYYFYDRLFFYLIILHYFLFTRTLTWIYCSALYYLDSLPYGLAGYFFLLIQQGDLLLSNSCDLHIYPAIPYMGFSMTFRMSLLGLRGLACFYGTDVITLVFRTLPDRSEDLRYPSTFGWPSPAVSPNSWMAEISAAVQPNGSTGGLLNNNLNNFSQEGCSDTIPKNIFGKDTSDEEKGRLMLAKLTTYPNLRRSLHSLNIARAYKYGSRSFGEKGWYTENFNIGKKLRTNDEMARFLWRCFLLLPAIVARRIFSKRRWAQTQIVSAFKKARELNI